MRKINPACKMLGILLPVLILAAVHDPVLNMIVFLVCVILMLASRVPARKLFMLMLPILLVALGMFFTGFYFRRQSHSPVNPDIFKLTDSAFWNGAVMSSRVLVYAGLGFLFVLTTDKIQLVLSLQQQFRLPPVFTYGLLAAWNIFPNMVREYRKTRAAFLARGLRPWPTSPALLKPMLVKAVYWSEALSVAMESKGFNGKSKRTEFYELRLSTLDILFPVAATGSLLIIILIRFSIL